MTGKTKPRSTAMDTGLNEDLHEHPSTAFPPVKGPRPRQRPKRFHRYERALRRNWRHRT